MQQHLRETFDAWIREAQDSPDDYVVALIDRILLDAARRSASDVHFQPGREGVEVRFRLDGVLHLLGRLPLEHAGQIAARLKVFAGLLTYRVDVPQEGRVRDGRIEGLHREMRISTAPTLFGERVVVRFFSPEDQCQYIETLGFQPDIERRLQAVASRRSGAVLIVGPSGSGKTTTAYALLRELVRRTPESDGVVRSIVSLEDPVEHALDGVSQIEVSSRSDAEDEPSRVLSLGRMLQYMMRQDPEVLMVGEIRERFTAEAAFQAALTGHLLISTFHAGSAVESIGRFLELGVEPFVLRSSIAFVLCQRLLRKLCDCAEKVEGPVDATLQGETYSLPYDYRPVGCSRCGGTGYVGRVPVAETLPLEDESVVHAILDRRATSVIERTAREHGMVPLAEKVVRLVEAGGTSLLEAKRVLG